MKKLKILQNTLRKRSLLQFLDSLFHPLKLDSVTWRAEHSNGITIETGKQTYEKINRKLLESFSLIFRKKILLTVSPKNRTLVVRRKVRDEFNLRTKKRKNLASFWIVALLAKSKNLGTTQHIACEFDPKWNNQLYEIDTDESSIHYLFQNGKIQVNTQFGKISPFNPIHLRPEEYKDLMKTEDPTERKS